jgi:D-alanyl-D-alanine-carboxypeptidase/D-alanyl-D-alanine-endopeptidase
MFVNARHDPRLTSFFLLLAGLLPLLASAAENPAQSSPETAAFNAADQIFEDFALDEHTPGLVYGVVADGRLVHVRTFGIQDLKSQQPATADSLFRIASMTKAFTALTVLQLRDEGLLRLDDFAEQYVPELRQWKYPTQDSPRIRVRDLLNHIGGMVTDDPWGDRQQSLPENEFTQLILDAAPFTRAPGTAFEYSNLGYALLGRIITNVSGKPFAETISEKLLSPLGMTASGFEAADAPTGQRAMGYRWEDNAWLPEPSLAHGAFGSMGGMQTSANDYAKWVGFLLSAWPPRDGADPGPVRRSSVRELTSGSNFPSLRHRYSREPTDRCPQARTYGMGMNVAIDCDLGLTLTHGGGYPGYGSYLLLLPERGVGIFAFANRTYASTWKAVWRAAVALDESGEFGSDRELSVTSQLATAYQAAGHIYATGVVDKKSPALAMNFLLDRGANLWAENLAVLKKEVGDCDTSAELTATGKLSGTFTWRCSHGRVEGSLLLAPTQAAGIQELELEAVKP